MFAITAENKRNRCLSFLFLALVPNNFINHNTYYTYSLYVKNKFIKYIYN